MSEIDYEKVPELVKRQAVKEVVEKLRCPACGNEWYDIPPPNLCYLRCEKCRHMVKIR